MKKGTKMRQLLVDCLYVNADGLPVDDNGEECAISGKPQAHSWELMRRSEKWIAEHPWKEQG